MGKQETTVDWLEQAAQAGTELRNLIRQAHEACRDLKTAKRELDDTIRQVRSDSAPRIAAAIDLEVTSQLDAYAERIEGATKSATDLIERGFRNLSLSMLDGISETIEREITEALARMVEHARVQKAPGGHVIDIVRDAT